MASHVRLITLRFDPELAAFDETPLAQALHGKVLLSLREHFFSYRGHPFLAFALELAEPRSAGSDRRAAACAAPAPQSGPAQPTRRSRNPTSEEIRAGLADAKKPIFDALRAWRKARAEDEAVPPYVILTNRQLIEICELLPRTKTGLLKVEGLGKRKAERYALEILERISASAKAAEATS